MRTSAVLFAALPALVACAARPAIHPGSSPSRYVCGDLELVRDRDTLLASELTTDGPMAPTPRGWSDDEGDHFVTFPTSATAVQVTEYVVPADDRADAIERVYDASRGMSRVDWRMTGQRVCQAQGGYGEAFARWSQGASIDEVAEHLSVDRAEARGMLHHALTELNRRYYGNHRIAARTPGHDEVVRLNRRYFANH